MNIYRNIILFHWLIFSICFCEISWEEKNKLLTGFRTYYNNFPNRVYLSEEGFLQNILQVGDSTYQLLVNLKVRGVEDPNETKLLKCTATVDDSDQSSAVKVLNYGCEEYQQADTSTGAVDQTPEPLVEITEPSIERKPVHLDNEVQVNTDVTSGEQFIAVPRNEPSAPCVGCSSYVNPQAEGVADLANLGVRHLDLHEPAVKHSLNTVLTVERQVQVVNGIRYILTLLINTNKCTEEETESCIDTKVCKITVLVKPWIKLPNGAKYRAILGNNCTEEWLYGDNGEVLPEPPTDNSAATNNNTPGEDIQVKHNNDLQSQPNQERELTAEEIKAIQEQIILPSTYPVSTTTPSEKQHVFKSESVRQNENVIPVTEAQKLEHVSNIQADKRKAIDDLLNFFDLSGFNPVSENSRTKRSYEDDLQVLSLAENFHDIKKSILNARFVYDMAQAMVDYINEIDMEIKNRAVKNVLKAEEETENNQRFMYVQALVTIPCSKVECGPGDTMMQICNGVIDSTNKDIPQILSAFCYNDKKETDAIDKVKDVDVNDPVLQTLAKQTIQTIETESNTTNAIKINKIVAAHTQVTSGTLTKMTIIIESLNCSKSVPVVLRVNCTVQEHLGAKLCDVIIHERHWLKEKKISYTCTERPADMRISKPKPMVNNVTSIDTKVDEMLQEALQYLESQSNRNNRQKIVNINSITSQIIAGFLTKIEFVIGYTNCTDENYSLNNCALLEKEDLRICKAQIWDRSWIMDGKQVEVTCDDAPNHNDNKKTIKKKRSIDLTKATANDVESDNDSYYEKLATESLLKYLKSTHSKQHYKVLKVERVNVRELSGKLIKMDFTISPTTCLLDSDGLVTSTECDIVNPKNISHCYSKILEQLWIDKKQYSVNCNMNQVNEAQTAKKKVKPLLMKQDNPNDPKYYQLAEEALKVHLDDTQNTSPHKVVRVVKVNTTQIASGMLTDIDFIISPKDDVEVDHINCNSKILEKLWLGTKAFNVTCATKVDRNDLREENPNNSEYMQIAVECLQQYIMHNPGSNLIRVTFVDEVVPQADGKLGIQFMATEAEDDNSGETICQAEYTEKVSKIHVKCYPLGKILLSISKLQSDDPNDPKYVKLADESFQEYLARMNITLNYNIVNIESASVKWKRGIKTVLIFVVALTDLNNNDPQTKRCLSQITERPWLHTRLVDIHCNLLEDLYRIKRHIIYDGAKSQVNRPTNIVGGIIERDPSDPRFKILAEESLQKYMKQSERDMDTLSVFRVEKVTTQIVEGELIRIDFVVSAAQDKSMICHSEVWERPWLGKNEIKVTCQSELAKIKRDVPGGLIEQDINNPKFKEYAEESLRKFALNSGLDLNTLSIERIERVTTQVVSGKVTRIDFIIAGVEDYGSMDCHSEVWERPWLHRTDINVDCQKVTEVVKRDTAMVGGLEEKDPNDSQYKQLAEESLTKYKADQGIDSTSLSVGPVTKVTTQVVAGSLTRIDFIVKDAQGQVAYNCHSEIWEQPWRDRKEINVTCQNGNNRIKRGVPGGQTDQDPNDPKYKQLAEESLTKYKADQGIDSTSLSVGSVTKVTTQVVAGSMTRIDFVVKDAQGQVAYNCHSEIWEQPWRDRKEINVTCQNGNNRIKRGVPGGQTDQDPNDPKYKQLAEESLTKYKADQGIDSTSLSVGPVTKVTTQVVAGSMTRIDFVVKDAQGQVAYNCHSEIWEQPWRDRKEINVTCQNGNNRIKRGVPGGQTDQDPNDSKYKQLAEESLTKYKADQGIDSTSLSVGPVTKVTTQVVAGSMTRIDFVVKDAQGQVAYNCHSEIWEQPWRDRKEINVTCQNGNNRIKRGVPGGQTDQDPNDPKYKQLAEESLTKYKADQGIDSTSLSVGSVTKVTTQVVAGSMTRIDFVVKDAQGQVAYNCHSEIWEQPWRDRKEINVTCQNGNMRLKRDIEMLGGVRESGHSYSEVQFASSPDKSKGLRLKREIRGNRIDAKDEESRSGNRSTLGARGFRGREEEVQDPNKNEYRSLAKDALAKYQRKSFILHKLIDVKRVVSRVVAGFKYEIDFTAAPTDCLVNVSKILLPSCDLLDSMSLSCHAEIWEQPWLKRKKIDVDCESSDADFDDYESDLNVDSSSATATAVDKKDPKSYKLAEEATDQYLTTSKRKYVHKVTDVYNVVEYMADGTITKLEFSISPTKCLRDETRTLNEPCEIKIPLTVFHCSAKIWDRPWLNVKKNITVHCKKMDKLKKKKRDLGVKTKRQSGDDDDLDEDATFYYADRAVQHLNDQSHSNNLHKLITIHATDTKMQMETLMVRMYIEVAETYCLRNSKERKLHDCKEMNGLNHRLCLARLWPSPDDELVIRLVSVVCDDDDEFNSITGLNILELLKLSIEDLESDPDNHFKLIHQGEPQIIPSLDSKNPIKLNFIVATTNCSKEVDLSKNPYQCFPNYAVPSKTCHSLIWLVPEKRDIRYITAKCPTMRSRRSLSPTNTTKSNLEIQSMVTEALEKLEMESTHRYKQRVLQINSHSTKITSGRVTTIDFDVGYTACLKYEWVENIASCDFIDHLPRRRCVAQVWERLWINNGRQIDVNCVDDETPLESHIEFDSAEMANHLAREALKHIEAKYPHPKKQKIVRIFSLEKQLVAGIHYRMKVEVGYTDCLALSEETNCKLETDKHLNKFCRINVWVRPWIDHPPNFRVYCDFQEGNTHELYHQVQAEHLFYNFLATYNPSYVNDYSQTQKRFEIFKANIKKIHELNVHERGTARYGVTRFTDLTYEEFSGTYMGLNTSMRDPNQIPMKKAEIPDVHIPSSFDWREYDAVTEVKDQGSCGSCWAFSVTGNIEGQWKMQSGQLLSLSEQELVDCDKLDDGCNGGLPDNAYRAIEQLGGLETESDYPYEGEGEKCEFNKTMAKVQISGAVNITTNETGMAQWLVHNGPISIGINANAMQFYMGGISHPWKMLCNPSNLDHGVLIVGYGVKDYPLFHKTLPYWIIKNSWGKSWGEQGYYRVYRGDGTCGVNQMASSAVI